MTMVDRQFLSDWVGFTQVDKVSSPAGIREAVSPMEW